MNSLKAAASLAALICSLFLFPAPAAAEGTGEFPPAEAAVWIDGLKTNNAAWEKLEFFRDEVHYGRPMDPSHRHRPEEWKKWSDSEKLAWKFKTIEEAEKEFLPKLKQLLAKVEAKWGADHSTWKDKMWAAHSKNRSMKKIKVDGRIQGYPWNEGDFGGWADTIDVPTRWRKWVAGSVISKVRKAIADDKDKWGKVYMKGRVFKLKDFLPQLDKLMASDPENGELKAAKGELEAKIESTTKECDEIIAKYEWGPIEPKGFISDTPAQECVDSFLKYWDDDRVLACRIKSKWWVYSKVLGTPSKYAISFELAYPHEEDSSLARVTYVTAFTEERRGVKRSPPFEQSRPNDKEGVGEEWTGKGGRYLSEEWYLMSRSNVPGGGGFIGMLIGGGCCCFVLLLAVAGGGFFAWKKGHITPEMLDKAKAGAAMAAEKAKEGAALAAAKAKAAAEAAKQATAQPPAGGAAPPAGQPPQPPTPPAPGPAAPPPGPPPPTPGPPPTPPTPPAPPA